MDASLKEKFLSKNLWIRVGFLVFLAIVSWLFIYVFLAILVVAIIQTVMTFMKGAPEKTILNVGESVVTFFAHVLRFVMYNTEEPPFPFSSWPGVTKKAPVKAPEKTPKLEVEPKKESEETTSE
jgi:energy-coupling factor transporter transmembrane protein EcfT